MSADDTTAPALAPVVVAVDPGLANTGVVVMAGRKIADAATFKTKSRGRPDFESVMERGQHMAESVSALVGELSDVEAVVIEEYEDFGGGTYRRSGVSDALVPNRWTTPVVCALIGSRLASLGYNVVWQRPAIVMARYRSHKGYWERKCYGLVEGDTRLTNDHVRSAACHGLAYLDGRRTAR
jgi:hypothetical protein